MAEDNAAVEVKRIDDIEVDKVMHLMKKVSLGDYKENEELAPSASEKAQHVETVECFFREIGLADAIRCAIKHGNWSTMNDFYMTKVFRIQRCALKLCCAGVPRKYWGIVSCNNNNNNEFSEPPEVDDKNYSRWHPEMGEVYFPVGDAKAYLAKWFWAATWETVVDVRNTDFIATLVKETWDNIPNVEQCLKEKLQSV